jgi:hypothetical protein
MSFSLTFPLPGLARETLNETRRNGGGRPFDVPFKTRCKQRRDVCRELRIFQLGREALLKLRTGYAETFSVLGAGAAYPLS